MLKVKDSTLAIAIILIFSLVPNGWAQQADEYNRKGVDLMDQGRYEEAIAAFDISIDIEPTGDVYYNKGIALDSLGRSEEAIAAYNQALIFNQTETDAYINKGVSLNSLGRYEEALAAYDKAIAIDPTNADAHYNKGVVLSNMTIHTHMTIDLLKHLQNITRL